MVCRVRGTGVRTRNDLHFQSYLYAERPRGISVSGRQSVSAAPFQIKKSDMRADDTTGCAREWHTKRIEESVFT